MVLDPHCHWSLYLQLNDISTPPPRRLLGTPHKRHHSADLMEEELDDKENQSPNIRVSDEFDDLHEKQLQLTPRRHNAITPKRQLRRRLRRRSCEYPWRHPVV